MLQAILPDVTTVGEIGERTAHMGVCVAAEVQTAVGTFADQDMFSVFRVPVSGQKNTGNTGAPPSRAVRSRSRGVRHHARDSRRVHVHDAGCLRPRPRTGSDVLQDTLPLDP